MCCVLTGGWACAAAGLTQFQPVRVDHCHDAWGLVLTAEAGWKLVLSGDTRPCGRLRDAGRGATLLVHEATFEPSMRAEVRQGPLIYTISSLSLLGKLPL